ncbi:MAG TPA: hypothetical protein ENI23_15070 [bacterium]|nr:hypothetical protein [bacterium]
MSAPTGYKQVPNQIPEQTSGLQQLLAMLQGSGAEGFEQAIQHLMGIISGSDESFASIEAPILRQFQEETLPQLQERITSQFGGGASSGQAQILGRAGATLQENLAAQRGEMRQQSVQALIDTYLRGQGIAQSAQPFGYQQEGTGFFGKLGKATGGAFTGGLQGAAIGSMFPGIGTTAGAVTGAIGGAAKSYFG